MADEIRILIADDHPLVRKGLRTSIEAASELKVVAEAGDGETALEQIRKLRPQVAVLDIDMPKLDGFGVAREIARQGPAVNIIFLTLHTDEDLFREAIELGAKGYILKDSAIEEVVVAVRAVAAGRPFYSSALTAGLLQPPVLHAAAVVSGAASQLTPTERRIMVLIAAGKSSKEIGAELSIHYRTVENHRTNICRKLGLEGANALVRYALQNKTEF